MQGTDTPYEDMQRNDTLCEDVRETILPRGAITNDTVIRRSNERYRLARDANTANCLRGEVTNDTVTNQRHIKDTPSTSEAYQSHEDTQRTDTPCKNTTLLPTSHTSHHPNARCKQRSLFAPHQATTNHESRFDTTQKTNKNNQKTQ